MSGNILKKIPYETRIKIVAQAMREISFARTYKQGKVKNWKINEDLYYGRKTEMQTSMANVDLGEMQAHVHSIMAKVDEPLVFKFTKRKKSQLKRVNRLNGLRIYDQDRDFWELKDIAMKKQCVIYGRTIAAYFADSMDGYQPHLEPVDVYDFLVDPAAGGLFLEKALYLGDYGVVKSKQQIKAGIKSGIYLRKESEELIEGASNATEQPQEEVNKINRTRDQNVFMVNKQISGSDKYKFWRWGTTFEGNRYYLLLNERGGRAIEVCPIEEKFESALWWYWTYAAFPDMTEFWTPSFCDYVRELIMAKAETINQMMDNSERINKPQVKVQSGAVENLSSLKYRREGRIIVKKDFDVNKAVQFVETPPIDAPLKVFEKLDEIQQRSGGVTAGDNGNADNKSGSKATIYEGNQANSADRFGFFNKSYSFGYKSFARLYEHGVREHLIKKEAIDILGPDGIEIQEVSRRDIFWKNDKFGVMVQSSNAELALSDNDKKIKLGFLAGQDKNPQSVQNKKKSYEFQAEIAGFNDEEIRQLLDTSEFGDEEIMADADRDIELILDGQMIPPNQEATTAYKQRFIDYMTKNQETELTDEEFMALAKYVAKLQPIIIRNTVKAANQTLLAKAMSDAMDPDKAGGGAPEGPGENENPQNNGGAPVVEGAPAGGAPGGAQ